MSFPRASGILLHPTSLPSRGGIGDFGSSAYAFADFLASARQGLWQVLPLGPLGFGDSPYSSTSAFAGNPLLISLERLADRGWIDHAQVDAAARWHANRWITRRFSVTRSPSCLKPRASFCAPLRPMRAPVTRAFCRQNQWWLDDFVLFDGLRARFKLESWNRWPRELTHREPAAIEKAHAEMAEELDIRRAVQFFFYEQWQALRAYCAQHSIRVVGDIAIFVNFDSVDVWTHPDLFRLNSELDPEVVAGVPPDFFSKDGQRWGNPLYRWDVMQAQGYAWWIDRMRWATHNFDYIRLDHFRGFSQYWEIPAQEPTAIHGRWVDGPKDDLFVKLREAWADSRSSPRISATLRPTSMHSATASRFRAWPCCNSALAMPAHTRICRTPSPRTRWSTPARTTTTRCSAGGSPERLNTSVSKPKPTWAGPMTECTGR